MPEPSVSPAFDAQISQRASDVVLAFVAELFAPLFLPLVNNDKDFACLAVGEMLGSYRAETQADLITVSQIASFGLAATRSAVASITPGTSPETALRLRNTANALSRSERAQRKARVDNQRLAALKRQQRRDQQIMATQPQAEARAAADLAETKRMLAEVQAVQAQAVQAQAVQAQARAASEPVSRPAAAQAEAHPKVIRPVAAISVPAISAAAGTGEGDAYKALWAQSCAAVAQEYMTGLSALSPENRKQATMNANLLSTVARDLLTGQPASAKPVIAPFAKTPSVAPSAAT